MFTLSLKAKCKYDKRFRKFKSRDSFEYNLTDKMCDKIINRQQFSIKMSILTLLLLLDTQEKS